MAQSYLKTTQPIKNPKITTHTVSLVSISVVCRTALLEEYKIGNENIVPRFFYIRQSNDDLFSPIL